MSSDGSLGCTSSARPPPTVGRERPPRPVGSLAEDRGFLELGLLAMVVVLASASSGTYAQEPSNGSREALPSSAPPDSAAPASAPPTPAPSAPADSAAPDSALPGSTPTGSAPEDSTRAEYARLVDEALREFGSGHFREAADVFRAAYALRPSARVLRGLGKAYFELGRYVDASTAFERALAGQLDPLEGALRTEVEELLVRSNRHVGTLELVVDPPSAEVVLDGRTVRSSTLRLDEGTHLVQATAPGYEGIERRVHVVPGERTQLELRLESRAGTDTRRRFAIAGGVAVAVGGGAVVTSALWLADRVRASSRCDAPDAGVVCANRGALIGERRAAAVTLVSGATVLLVGAGLLIAQLGRRTEDGSTESAYWSCGPSHEGASCVWGGSF